MELLESVYIFVKNTRIVSDYATGSQQLRKLSDMFPGTLALTGFPLEKV